MTYRDLLDHLEQLEDEQLNLKVMCFFDDEFYKATGCSVQEKDGCLDDGYPFIEVE